MLLRGQVVVVWPKEVGMDRREAGFTIEEAEPIAILHAKEQKQESFKRRARLWD